MPASQRPKRKAGKANEASAAKKAEQEAVSTHSDENTASKRQKSDADKNDDTASKSREGEGDGNDGNKGIDDALRKRVEYLLSDEAFAIAYPPIEPGHGEKDLPQSETVKPKPKKRAGQMEPDKVNEKPDAKRKDQSTGKHRGFSSPDLTPFEVLLCAALLSKPLSHRLQLRTIATLLSPPYSQTTPSAIEKAGFEGRREVMYEARTQHKEKTADSLGSIVDGLRTINGKKEEDVVALTSVRKASEGGDVKSAADKISKMLTTSLKGFGAGGAGIFLRRIQAQDGWDGVFPYLDERSAEGAQELGLVPDSKAGDALNVAQHLSHVVCGQCTKSKADYVRLVDVIVGLQLEKKVDEVVKKME